jgi:S1-C subfamily serine protease
MTKTFTHLSSRTVALFGAIAVAAAVAVSLALANRSSAATVGTGVVNIRTVLGYEGGAAAGTGIVLTSNGEVLTNNHVIRGATSIRVVIPQTGRSYAAKVVGYDVSDDVALLKLNGASNLRTATLGDSSKLSVGQQVTATGNAGGTGRLTSATGRITGLGKTITAGDEQNGSEQLDGLIEMNAALQPGDSGGPLYDSAQHVIGMNTAASVGFYFQSTASTDAYAIPINAALKIVKQIESGTSTSTIHVGGTPFVGVQISSTGGFGFGDSVAGGYVAAVVPGSPASKAGLAPGDVITAVAGRTVSSSDDVLSALTTKVPGARVKLTWVDQFGTQQRATITLANGPAL